MRLLGAVLAGGRSTRFGSDKASAMVGGKQLIQHAIEALAVHAEAVVCCGRSLEGVTSLDDRPAPGEGPLAGLNAALHHAGSHGFDAVLCAPIDVHPLAPALKALRGNSCAVLASQWTIGIWPVLLGPPLERHLANGHRSFRSWLELTKPTLISDAALGLRNFNRPADLEQ